VVAQVALLGQLLPQVQDQILDVGRCALHRPRDRRLIVPGDAVQSLAACVLDPVVDGRLRDAEAACDFALGQAASDGLDDLATALSRQALLLMATSRWNAVPIKATSWHAFSDRSRPVIVQTSMIGRSWQLPDR
jgi:hypothetical protein